MPGNTLSSHWTFRIKNLMPDETEHMLDFVENWGTKFFEVEQKAHGMVYCSVVEESTDAEDEGQHWHFLGSFSQPVTRNVWDGIFKRKFPYIKYNTRFAGKPWDGGDLYMGYLSKENPLKHYGFRADMKAHSYYKEFYANRHKVDKKEIERREKRRDEMFKAVLESVTNVIGSLKLKPEKIKRIIVDEYMRYHAENCINYKPKMAIKTDLFNIYAKLNSAEVQNNIKDVFYNLFD